MTAPRKPTAATSSTPASSGTPATGGLPASPADAPDRAGLGRWLVGQRWYATPATDDTDSSSPDGGSGIDDLTVVDLPTDPPLAVGLLTTDAHDRYQLLLAGSRPGKAGRAASARTTGRGAGRPAPDLALDPDALAGLLGHFVATDGSSQPGPAGTVVGSWLPDATPLGDGPARMLGAEQSNTSAVIGSTHVLKLFRRLQAGPHPELEIGRHLAAVATTHPAPVAALAGWYELVPTARAADGTDGGERVVLGVAQDLVPGAADGWTLVLAALADDPGQLLPRLHDLGADLATLHAALAQPARASSAAGVGDSPVAAADPESPEAFGTTPLGADRIAGVVEGTVAAAVRVLASATDAPDLAPVVGRAADVATLAATLAAAVGDDAGVAIRHHGDLHLGQLVVGPDGWVFLDFEGEPTRPLAERRRRHGPLRDVAGLLRSLAYAAATHRRSGGRHLEPGWEPAARAAVLDGYLAAVDPALLPTSAVATARLLTLFELEKVVYEIAYELAHRPDWVALPVHGLSTLLATEA